MVYNRTGYAPWSLTREAGVQSATVDGTIEVPQYIQPTLDTGFVDEKGNWKGIKSNDEVFFIDAPHIGVANGAQVLSPQTADRDFIDMTGFTDLFIAIRPSNGGNVSLVGVMGPDSRGFANLSPTENNAVLKGMVNPSSSQSDLENLLFDSADSLTADVWNIFFIGDRFQNQKNLQLRIGNNSGGISNIDFAYLRMV